MLGVRMSFHVKPFIDWLDDGSLNWFWEVCERCAIPAMALVPGMPGKVRPIVASHPDLRILIPHMGFGLDARGDDAFACLDELLELARYPNVVVNVSSRAVFFQRALSISRYSSGHPTHLRHLRTPADAVGKPTSVDCVVPTAIVLPNSKRRSISFRG